MLAILATYVIKSRQNEVVTWTSAGLSIYRLLLPCFFATAALGVVNWEIQERILPVANRIQDELRTQIRSQGSVTRSDGKYWLYEDDKIITFQASESDNETTGDGGGSVEPGISSASDNEKRLTAVKVLQFTKGGSLQLLYRSEKAFWRPQKLVLSGPVDSAVIQDGRVQQSNVPGAEVELSADPYLGVSDKPSHLTKDQLQERLAQ